MSEESSAVTTDQEVLQPKNSNSSPFLQLSVANLTPGETTSSGGVTSAQQASGVTSSSTTVLPVGEQEAESQSSDNEFEASSQDNFSLKSGQFCHTSYSLLSGNSSGAESLASNDGSDSAVIDKMTSTQARVNNNDLKSSSGSVQEQLDEAKEAIKKKDEEIERLSRIRGDVEAEVEDLTASLFEEAHKMVRDANIKQASAERAMAEANMKIDGLETEVAALKTLVLTSTPSNPNKHLHPQLDTKRNGKRNSSTSSNSSPSSSKSNSLNRGIPGLDHAQGGLSPASTSFNGVNGPTSLGSIKDDEVDGESEANAKNIDPVIRGEYLSWKKSPSLDPSNPFLKRIYEEDIDRCLDFENAQLAKDVLQAIQDNTLCLSPVKDFNAVPRNCSLLESPLLCRFTLRLSEKGDESFVSQLARNRIAAVCDCVTYLRYIVQGLVKAHVNDVYWEIMNLRRKMALARLGFTPE